MSFSTQMLQSSQAINILQSFVSFQLPDLLLHGVGMLYLFLFPQSPPFKPRCPHMSMFQMGVDTKLLHERHVVNIVDIVADLLGIIRVALHSSESMSP
jgi:hypothetical protein